MSIKETDFNLLKGLLKEFKPKEQGYISGEEVEQIEKALFIKERDLLSLRNLRNFTVLFMHNDESKWEKEPMKCREDMDKCSAITSVIDHAIFDKGGEV